MTASSPNDRIEPVYLELQDVYEIYSAIMQLPLSQVGEFVRSEEGLLGALGRPRWHADLTNADLPYQAAVLAHGVAESQSFIDGNKRTALIAMLTFLEVNGITITASDDELASWILQLSEGLTAEALANFIRLDSQG